MKVAVFNTKSYDRTFLTAANVGGQHELVFFEPHLTLETSVLAAGFPAVCAFVNDCLDAKTLGAIAEKGVRLLALRSAGFNHVDLAAAKRFRLNSPASSCLFSLRRRGTRSRYDVVPQPQNPPGLQPRPRRQFRPRRLVGF
jgi:hypothetical protein